MTSAIPSPPPSPPTPIARSAIEEAAAVDAVAVIVADAPPAAIAGDHAMLDGAESKVSLLSSDDDDDADAENRPPLAVVETAIAVLPPPPPPPQPLPLQAAAAGSVCAHFESTERAEADLRHLNMAAFAPTALDANSLWLVSATCTQSPWARSRPCKISALMQRATAADGDISFTLFGSWRFGESNGGAGSSSSSSSSSSAAAATKTSSAATEATQTAEYKYAQSISFDVRARSSDDVTIIGLVDQRTSSTQRRTELRKIDGNVRRNGGWITDVGVVASADLPLSDEWEVIRTSFR